MFPRIVADLPLRFPLVIKAGSGGNPLMLATHNCRRPASKAIAPGNHPTGISPSSFERRFSGANSTRATAFCVPLAT